MRTRLPTIKTEGEEPSYKEVPEAIITIEPVKTHPWVTISDNINPAQDEDFCAELAPHVKGMLGPFTSPDSVGKKSEARFKVKLGQRAYYK